MTAAAAMFRYSMSFTSGTLLHRESLTIADLYAELHDWDAVRSTVLAENRLQMRTANASQRLYREIASRLKQLTADEFDLLLHGLLQEQSFHLTELRAPGGVNRNVAALLVPAGLVIVTG